MTAPNHFISLVAYICYWFLVTLDLKENEVVYCCNDSSVRMSLWINWSASLITVAINISVNVQFSCLCGFSFSHVSLLTSVHCMSDTCVTIGLL